MQAKCPVRDYVIEAVKIEVKVGDKLLVVCCKECADKVRRQPDVYARAVTVAAIPF